MKTGTRSQETASTKDQRTKAKAGEEEIKRIEVEVGSPRVGIYRKAFKGKWLVEPRFIGNPADIVVNGLRAIPPNCAWGVALTEKRRLLVYKGNAKVEGQEQAGGEVRVFNNLAEAQNAMFVPNEIVDVAFAQTNPRTGRLVEMKV